MLKIFDVHSHWGTRRGYPLQSEAELAKQKQVWNSEPRYHSEDEMADYFRSAGVRTILDFGFTKNLPHVIHQNEPNILKWLLRQFVEIPFVQ